MLRRLGVRGKILATLAVPVLVLILGAGYLVASAYDTWNYSQIQTSYLGAVVVEDGVIDALQQERWTSVSVATGRTTYSKGLAETRKATDDAISKLDRALSQMDRKSSNAAVNKTMADAIKARAPERLALARTLVDERTGQGTSGGGTTVRNLMSYYDSMIDAQLELGDILSTTVRDRGLGTYVVAYTNTNRLVNNMQIESQSGQILIEDSFLEMDTEIDRRSVAVQMAEGTSVRDNAVRTVEDLGIQGLVIPELSTSFVTARDGLLQAAPSTIPLQYRTQWEDNAATEYQRILKVRDELRNRAVDFGDSVEAAATRELLITIAAALLAVVASIFIALTVARTITEPLRRLTDAAGRVRDELPRIVDEVAEPGQSPDVTVEKIEVNSQDEVGKLATAFNEVNAVTLRVAREQASLRGSIAEMFINVARRDQVLLNRQLIFLDELERSEEDPGTLSNLFRLDHLATRMRRNAESLLVLAGIESGRRVRAAMPLSDVVRTASSEIELYERVELDLHVDPLMLGHNALPAAHLIAELLENATVFSDPGTPVIVSVEEDSRWITVAVLDEGLGMTDEELDEANEKASTYAASEIVGAQRLGLYVVGRLAYKLGASVRFSRPEGRQGTLARVMLPRALFLAPDEVPLDAPVDVLSKDTREATEAWVAPEPAAAGALSSRRAVEPEPPVAVPVDLDALTDGSTSTGMPRRKTRVTTEAEAPSVALGSLEEKDIVLPELAASELPSDFVAGADELWTPPSAAIAHASLPSRGAALPARRSALPTRPTALTPHEPVAEPAPTVAPAPERAAVFSNFRTRRSLEFMGETVEPRQSASEAAPAPSVPELAVPDLVAPDVVPSVEPDLPVFDAHQDAAVQALEEPWSPSFAGGFSELGESRGAEPAVEDPAPSYEALHGVSNEPWQPVQADELPAPTREDERLRSLGAHVGSIASAVDVDDEAYPDVPTRRGRYARYDEDRSAETHQQPDAAASGPVFTAPPVVVPEPEIDPALGFAIPGLVDDELHMPALADEHVQDFAEPVAFAEPTAYAEPLPQRGAPVDAHVAYPPAPAAQVDEHVAYPPAPAAQVDEHVAYPPAAAPVVEQAPVYVAPQPAVEEPLPAAPMHTLGTPGANSPDDRGFLPMPAASADIASFAVTSSGAPLPSFSDVLGSAPAPAAAPEPQEPKRGLFGLKRKKKQAAAAAPSAPAPSAPSAPAPSGDWGFAPGAAPVAPAPAPAPRSEAFAPAAYQEPVASYEAPAAAPAMPVRASVAPVDAAPLQRRSPSSFTPQPIEPEGFTYSPPTFGSAVSSAVESESTGRPAPSATAFFGSRGDAAPAPTPAAAPAPAPQATSWGASGGMDSELSARLALQAGIQEQALAELSQLSSYRPNQMAGDAASNNLTKRVRTEVPASTLPDEGSSKISRDAAELRSRLSSFVSATNRARQEGDAVPGQDVHEQTHDPAPQSR